jgi:chloramphenicol 3-O-phosphotransferase
VRRERARGDRTLGEALAQYRAMAESIGHDLTIDTTETEPALAAERILAAIKKVRTVSPSLR